MAYDAELDLLYIGTGNGSPWNQGLRSPGGGDNLFLSSIVALRPDDGTYVWHYQTTPGESWDYTATQPIVVADLPLDGAPRRVVMQAPKNGFFYVLDAATGALISADKFAAVNWASRCRPRDGAADRESRRALHVTGQAVALQPSSGGAHNWHPMAFSPQTGLVYLSASDNALVYAPDRNFNPNPRVSNLGIDLSAGATLGPGALAALPRGSYTLAWDPVAKREAWRVDGPSAGMLATAGGLVFRGFNDRLVAYAATDGRELWSSAEVHTGIVAGPISFELDGVQHIAVVAGRATGNYYAPDYSRLLVFRRGANTALPPEREFTPPPLNPPPSVATAEQIARGRELYDASCVLCHDDPGNAGGIFRRGLFPDLAYSPDASEPRSVCRDRLGRRARSERHGVFLGRARRGRRRSDSRLPDRRRQRGAAAQRRALSEQRLPRALIGRASASDRPWRARAWRDGFLSSALSCGPRARGRACARRPRFL